MDEATLTLLRRAQAPTAPTPRVPTLAKLSDYANGEQFGGSNGTYWRGRRPNAGLNDELQRSFVQDDQIGPAIDRLVDAIVGRDFEWNLADATVPEGQDQPPEVQETIDALAAWHTAARFHKAVRDAKRAEQWGGVSCLRVFIPTAYADKAVQGGAASLAEALELIHIMAVPATAGGVLRDEFDRELGYWYRYTTLDDGNVEKQLLELHTPTEIRVCDPLSLEPIGEAVPNPLFDEARLRRPRFLMQALERVSGPVITPSIIDLQDRLNVSWTNLARNDDLAGYRSIISVNAEGPADESGKPIPWTMGPAIVTELRGVVWGDGNAKQMATPNVIIVDPVNPATYCIPTIQALRESLLEAFDQLWTLNVGVNVSGESKRESRKSFDKRTASEAANVAEGIRWALGTVLRLAAWLQGNPTMYDALTVTPKLFLDTSNGDLATFQALLPAFQAGTVSLETMVEANPAVSDADAELQRLSTPTRLSPASIASLVPANVLSQRRGLIALGFTPDEADRIVQERLSEAEMGAAGLAPVGAGA
ncbi:MAG TPA: hypothetical protein VHN99_06875 [Deinococcales bacterium]|nr:hypothetical protein [Deinococcales bacterium]